MSILINSMAQFGEGVDSSTKLAKKKSDELDILSVRKNNDNSN